MDGPSDWLSIIVGDLTGADPLTALQVDCIYANHPHAPGTNIMDSYWTITPVGSGFAADLVLPHANLSEPEIGRYRNGAWDWGNAGFDSVTVYRTNLTAFGDFAVFNTTLVATNATYARAPGLSLKIRLADLVQNLSANPVAGQSLGASAQGATLTWSTNYLFYRPVAGNNNDDTFTYTVSNGIHAATGTITVAVAPLGGIARAVSVSGGTATVRFFGLPGLAYDVQRTTSLSGPVEWTTLTATPLTPGADGAFDFTDPAAPGASAYYRSLQH